MKKILFAFSLSVLMACTSASVTQTGKTQTSKAIETGFNDDDTYTVSVEDATAKQAIEKAKYQILKDIVDVRVKNDSRYTDIIKIQGEFEIPLRNGKVIKEKDTARGVQIYFQIRENGLRQKFQRK